MKRSPRRLLLCLLAGALLSSAATATPALARTRIRSGHPATPTRQADKRASHAGKRCRRWAECSGHTGGTPAKSPRVPKRPREPKRTGSKTVAPGPSGNDTPAEQTAAVIAGVLAVPCANAELTPSAENLPLVRTSVLCLINRIRAEHGLIPLAVNPRLESAAEGHCAELISANYFAHIAPDGETPVDRIRKTGYIPGPSFGYVIGENLAWGTYSLSTPQAIVAAWVASPGHLANILESQYRETGIGIVPAVPASLGGGSPGASYAQEFGVIIH